MAAVVVVAPTGDGATVTVPVHLVLDDQVQWRPDPMGRFQARLWAQTVRDLARCGVQLQTTVGAGSVQRSPYREPVITGLQRGVINLVLTTEIPVKWDGGRALCGVTTLYRGHHLCMVAINHAHGHQVPFFSVNTCLHEILHALLHDILEQRPEGVAGQAREIRVDYHATRLWLFHEDSAVREAARTYLDHLRQT